MLSRSVPSSFMKCGFIQVRGRTASRVAFGIRPFRSVTISDSTIFVTVTSPIFHFIILLPLSVACVLEEVPHLFVEEFRNFRVDRVAAVQIDHLQRLQALDSQLPKRLEGSVPCAVHKHCRDHGTAEILRDREARNRIADRVGDPSRCDVLRIVQHLRLDLRRETPRMSRMIRKRLDCALPATLERKRRSLPSGLRSIGPEGGDRIREDLSLDAIRMHESVAKRQSRAKGLTAQPPTLDT